MHTERLTRADAAPAAARRGRPLAGRALSGRGLLWPGLGAGLLAVGLGVLAIAASTAWHAVSIVRPPRLDPDAADIQAQLPGSQAVSFQAPDGVMLRGTFVPSKNGAYVVLLHGLFGNRRQTLPEAQVLSQYGYGVLIYDNRAHGDSGGSVATWGQLESGDAERAVDFVQQRGAATAGRIGLLGFSIGGTAVLRAAEHDSRIGAVVVEATYSSMAGEIAQMFGKYGVLSELPALWTGRLLGGMDYAQLVPEQMVCGLGPRPLLLVYGTADPDVPPAQARRMAEAACQPSSLLMIDTHLHGRFMEADPATYTDRLLGFFDAALGPSGTEGRPGA